MTKKLILPVAALALVLGQVACNSSSNEDYAYETSSSVLVSSFSLAENDNILDSLQNVFFTINLEDAQIYNADSLPYGTNVSRLITNVTAISTASAVTLEYPRENMTDSVVNYLTNSTDSIDFSLGPVKLRVVSQSGLVERVYQVKVNVHQVKPDTLSWSSMAKAPLPSAFDKLDAQCTANLNGVFYSLSKKGSNYCLAYTTNPDEGTWTVGEQTYGFSPVVNTLRASDDALYILSEEGTLYKSGDGMSWEATTETWSYIYGGYGIEILGCAKKGDSWKICSYPSLKEWNMPVSFPISGTSLPAVYETSMAFRPQLVMLGGKDAYGNYLDSSWSFDGESWANIANVRLPEALEDVTLVPYNLFDVPSSTWTPKEYPVLLVLGGKNDEGLNRIVYYSTDWGMTWREAPDLIQLPEELPAFYKGYAFVYSVTMQSSRSAYEWTPITIKSLPKNCRFVEPESQLSRVTKPITEWECPAIYLFGPTISGEVVVNEVLRARILRYTFQPVY